MPSVIDLLSLKPKRHSDGFKESCSIQVFESVFLLFLNKSH